MGGDKNTAENEQRHKREQLTLTSRKAPAAADQHEHQNPVHFQRNDRQRMAGDQLGDEIRRKTSQQHRHDDEDERPL